MKYRYLFGSLVFMVITGIFWLRPVFAENRQGLPTVERVSLKSGGLQGIGSFDGGISADGRYAVFSSEGRFIPEDSNNQMDVFVYDRLTQVTDLVSVASNGNQGNNRSGHPQISADGRYVAFASRANNLVPNDTNNVEDIFLHDRQSHTTERISVANDGSQATSLSLWYPAISADGRFVVFFSVAPNLVQGDTNNRWDVFVRDRVLGNTERVSVASDGTQGNDHSYFTFIPDITPDGRYVTFTSRATNLVSIPTSPTEKIFIRDRQTDQTMLESMTASGAVADNSSVNPSISNDGQYLVFESRASNLVPNDTNNRWDIFLKDRNTEEIWLVTRGYNGLPATLDSNVSQVSGDGRFITFRSDANNLVPNDGNECESGDEICGEVYVYDRLTGLIQRISSGFDGSETNGIISSPRGITPDGRFIVFSSDSSNIISNDTNNAPDQFLYDQGEEILLTPTPSNTPTTSPTPSNTPTPTLTPTATATLTLTPGHTATATPSNTPSPPATATNTVTPTYSPTSVNTPTVTASSTTTPTYTPVPSPTLTATATPTYTSTPSVTPSPSATATAPATPMPTTTPGATTTIAATPSATPGGNPTTTATKIPVTITATYASTSTPTAIATIKVTLTWTPAVSTSTASTTSTPASATPTGTTPSLPTVTSTSTGTPSAETPTPTGTATREPGQAMLYLPLIQLRYQN